MLYLPKSDLLYLHIHKNAGRSVKALLRRAYLAQYPEAAPPEPRTFKARADIPNHIALCDLIALDPSAAHCDLAVMARNPWDRLHSAYSHFRLPHIRSRGAGRAQIGEFDDFRDYVRRLHASWKAAGPGRDNPFHRPAAGGQLDPERPYYSDQLSYLRVEGEPASCRVLRFERLEQDISALIAAFFPKASGMTPPHVGSSAKGAYRDAYDAEMREMVGEIYAEDIGFFGYEFEPGARV